MSKQAVNPEAKDYYSRGRQALRSRSEEALSRARSCFQSALDVDPGFAPAYSGLADAYTLLYIYHMLPRDEGFPKAKAAAEKAMQLDDSLAEVHATLGHISKVFDGDLEKAEQEYMRAISIDPEYATAHHWYSALLNARGHFESALREVEQALCSDPESTTLRSGAGLLRAKLGHWDKAVASFDKAVGIDPKSEMIRLNYALVLAQMGRNEQGLHQVEKALELAPGSSFVKGVYGSLLYYDRQYDRAIAVLAQAIGQTVKPSPMGRLILGQCYLEKGLYRDALEQFCEAEEPSDTYTPGTDLSVVAASLRGIALARMGELDKARKILNDLASQGDERAAEPCWFGLLCIALGDRDRGFQSLEQAAGSGDMWLRYIRVQPLFDGIRSEPEYKALVERMNLGDVQSA
jgi:tetratricopeptide (TPR) repeat protein